VEPVPGYDESVPMTDQSLPESQINARWRSGSPTLATSGAAWVRGRQWASTTARRPSRPEGIAAAVHALRRGGQLRLCQGAARRASVRPTALVAPVGNGDLLVTTANGGSRDCVLRIHPHG
jgi:hypothetical protein